MTGAAGGTAGDLPAWLSQYSGHSPAEERDLERVRRLVREAADPYDHALSLHLTGSAVVVHPQTSRILLRWHARIGGWLQVGGHGDPGERDPYAVARREATEETGLADLTPWPDAARRPLHVVVVAVPANGHEPAHEHADVRYLLATSDPEAAVAETPSAPLRWVSMTEAIDLVNDNLVETLSRLGALLDPMGERGA